MEKLKKISALSLAFTVIFCLTGCAASPASTEPAPTDPPPVIAAAYVDTLDPESELIRSLTAGTLYELSADGGEIIPAMAASLPVDATQSYAGSYGIPAGAVRGYAFRIDLNPEACYADGAPITAEDYIASMRQLLSGETAEDWTFLANARGYLDGRERQTDHVISLARSGISSVAEARELGYMEFYLDVTAFWGIGDGWAALEDTRRLRDHAMPGGLDEFYVSAAYLYEHYLADGAAYDYLQSEFVGISADPSDVLTIEDVGIVKTGDHQITLITEFPTTAEALALKLKDFSPTGSGGPYRLSHTGETLMELERNENWWGGLSAYPADIIRIRVEP